MKLYILIKYIPLTGTVLRWKLGGGSSTRAGAKVYDNKKQAERYAKQYGAEVVEINV